MSHESVRIKRLEAYMHLIALLIVVFVVGLYIGYWNGYSDGLYDCIDNLEV